MVAILINLDINLPKGVSRSPSQEVHEPTKKMVTIQEPPVEPVYTAPMHPLAKQDTMVTVITAIEDPVQETLTLEPPITEKSTIFGRLPGKKQYSLFGRKRGHQANDLPALQV